MRLSDRYIAKGLDQDGNEIMDIPILPLWFNEEKAKCVILEDNYFYCCFGLLTSLEEVHKYFCDYDGKGEAAAAKWLAE